MGQVNPPLQTEQLFQSKDFLTILQEIGTLTAIVKRILVIYLCEVVQYVRLHGTFFSKCDTRYSANAS